MSLIQDALRRKLEETPVPDIHSPVTPPSGEKGPKMPQVFLLLILLAVFLAAPIGYSLYLIKQKPLNLPLIGKKTHPVAAPAVSEPVVAPAPVIEASAPVTPPVQAVETVKVEIVVEPVKKEEPVPEIKPAWPGLKLTGIASSGSQRIAIINGKMLTVGRTVSEVTVREVHETDVVVEFSGERRVLHVDE
ncbi:MAG: GspB domain-containing protein [Kiritimatiellaceae bacterium]|nr:GspB domain-containing protein [Kiritimatiellaceae bacterium]